MNEQLKTRQEHDNAEDEFAVALYEDDPNPEETVGHGYFGNFFAAR